MANNTEAAAVELRKKSRVLADRIIQILAEIGPPMGVRQMFYQCVVRTLVPNSRAGYRKVQRLLDLLRDSGEVGEDDITDRSRPVHQVSMWNDPRELLSAAAAQYRKDLWETQDERVEVWLEKDALVGVVERVTREFGVILVPARGFASRTGLYQASQRINDEKPTTIYYLGDHDPSGLDMDRDIQDRLEAKFGSTPDFKRLAILPEDIKAFSLPPLRVKDAAAAKEAGKKRGDSRAEKFKVKFGTGTVELDALPADELRRRIREAIRSHINDEAWERAQRAEAAELESIEEYAKAWKKLSWLRPTFTHE